MSTLEEDAKELVSSIVLFWKKEFFENAVVNAVQLPDATETPNNLEEQEFTAHDIPDVNEMDIIKAMANGGDVVWLQKGIDGERHGKDNKEEEDHFDSKEDTELVVHDNEAKASGTVFSSTLDVHGSVNSVSLENVDEPNSVISSQIESVPIIIGEAAYIEGAAIPEDISATPAQSESQKVTLTSTVDIDERFVPASVPFENQSAWNFHTALLESNSEQSSFIFKTTLSRPSKLNPVATATGSIWFKVKKTKVLTSLT